MVKDLEKSRHVYLVRHGTPVFPGKGQYCIGITDIPLSREGENQGRLAGAYLRSKGVRQCYTSPLLRALDTARAMDIPLHIHPKKRSPSPAPGFPLAPAAAGFHGTFFSLIDLLNFKSAYTTQIPASV